MPRLACRASPCPERQLCIVHTAAAATAAAAAAQARHVHCARTKVAQAQRREVSAVREQACRAPRVVACKARGLARNALRARRQRRGHSGRGANRRTGLRTRAAFATVVGRDACTSGRDACASARTCRACHRRRAAHRIPPAAQLHQRGVMCTEGGDERLCGVRLHAPRREQPPREQCGAKLIYRQASGAVLREHTEG
eukprot:186074-Chlamydomonas_euryale.AAC.1